MNTISKIHNYIMLAAIRMLPEKTIQKVLEYRVANPHHNPILISRATGVGVATVKRILEEAGEKNLFTKKETLEKRQQKEQEKTQRREEQQKEKQEKIDKVLQYKTANPYSNLIEISRATGVGQPTVRNILKELGEKHFSTEKKKARIEEIKTRLKEGAPLVPSENMKTSDILLDIFSKNPNFNSTQILETYTQQTGKTITRERLRQIFKDFDIKPQKHDNPLKSKNANKQEEILKYIEENPTYTQNEVSEKFDISLYSLSKILKLHNKKSPLIENARKTEDNILNMITKEPHLTGNEISRRLGVAPMTVSKVLRKLGVAKPRGFRRNEN